jgi:NADH-quinone oxidoreductase subunit L
LVTAIALLAPLVALAVVLNAGFTTFLAPLAYIDKCAAPSCGSPTQPLFISIPYVEDLGSWITVGALHIDFTFVLDQLSLVMLLVVTGVGFLIHIYSVGYMEGRRRLRPLFLLFESLPLFHDHVLVLAGNALLMFVGWEGVGLASYLLIGFWFHQKVRC